MAEKDSKPTKEEPNVHSGGTSLAKPTWLWWLLPVALATVALVAFGCGSGDQSSEPSQQEAVGTPSIALTSESRSPQSSAALTRVASTLAQAQDNLPTTTPTAVSADSALVPLPTVTPTVVPSPVATRTVEIRGDATLRLQLNNDTFASSGQPIVIDLEPRTYTLGDDMMTQSDEWCTQLGPTGLVFDLTFALQPATENLYVAGELRLYDGFCGEWGSLGNHLSTVPMNVNVPVGTTVILAPTLQVQGSFLGLPNVLDISTGVFLDLTIRNPNPR